MSVTVTLTFASIADAAIALSGMGGQVAGAEAAIKGTPNKGKPAPAASPAATPSPAAPQPSGAQKPKDPESDKPSSDTKQPEADKPKVPTYEQSGISEKLAGYLGDKNSDGYGDRRAKIVGLLTEFNVKSGKDLKPEQYAAFIEKLDAVTAPGEDLG